MSFSVVIVQYLLPCAVVTMSYISICRYLDNKPILTTCNAKQNQIMARRKRNNRMLIIVSITHFMSWLPLNVVNVIITALDSADSPLFKNVENLLITYAICHLASMTSAISNPLLYGFMNENFRGEFRKILRSIRNCGGDRPTAVEALTMAFLFDPENHNGGLPMSRLRRHRARHSEDLEDIKTDLTEQAPDTDEHVFVL